MYTWLTLFIDKHKLLYELQFGFREKFSTSHALVYFTDKILKGFDNGLFTIGVFIDFSKAFDSVNHSILLDKLKRYVIRGNSVIMRWLWKSIDKEGV